MQKILPTLLLAAFCFGCKENNPAPPAESRTAMDAIETVPPKAEVPPEPASEISPPKIKIGARAQVLPPQEGFQETFDLSIHIAENNSASGRATVGADALDLTGAVTDGKLRLWAVGSEGAGLKGGFFIGEIKGDKGEGTFALSGSGGAPNLRGSWQTL